MIQDIDTRPPSLFLMRVFYYWVAISLFIAVLNKQWELTFLGCIVLGMVFGAKTWRRLSLKRVHSDLSVPINKLFPGDTLKISVRLENAKWLPIWVQLRVNVDRRLQSRIEEKYLSKATWVGSYHTTHFGFRLPFRQRGVYAIGPFEIQAGDLLGFFTNGHTSPEKFEAVVYPRVTQLKPISLPRHDFFGTPGAKHPVEDPIYLLGTRDYEHRRPAKFIHWKASARLNRLQEKLCEPSAQAKAMLTIDVAPFEAHGAADAFEEMLEVAASMAIQWHGRGLAIGLMTNGKTLGDVPGVLKVGHGTHQLSTILETMARLGMKAKEKMEDTLMSGFGPTAGVSFAHFSHLPGKATHEVEGIYAFLKLSGAFFVCRPIDDAVADPEVLPSNYHYLNDIRIYDETTEDHT